jgi:hypothetical protein
MPDAKELRTNVLQKVDDYNIMIEKLRESRPGIKQHHVHPNTKTQRIALRAAARNYDEYMASSNVIGDDRGDYPKSLRGTVRNIEITEAEAAGYAAAFNMKSIKEEEEEETKEGETTSLIDDGDVGVIDPQTSVVSEGVPSSNAVAVAPTPNNTTPNAPPANTVDPLVLRAGGGTIAQQVDMSNELGDDTLFSHDFEQDVIDMQGTSWDDGEPIPADIPDMSASMESPIVHVDSVVGDSEYDELNTDDLSDRAHELSARMRARGINTDKDGMDKQTLSPDEPQPVYEERDVVNVLTDAPENAGFPTTSNGLLSKIGDDGTAVHKTIEQLKLGIKAFHELYEKFIPLFKTKAHQVQKKKALASKDIQVVRYHYEEMERAIKSFYASEDGNLKVGVIISAENFLKQFGGSAVAPPQPITAPQAPQSVMPPSNVVGRGITTDPGANDASEVQTGISNDQFPPAQSTGAIVYGKDAHPYSNRTQERQVLLKQGGTRHYMSRGVGTPIKGFPPSAAAGYIDDPVLRNDDRTGYDWIRRARVIQRFPSEYKIK